MGRTDQITSALRYESVLGQLTATARAQIAADPINCSQFNFSATNTGVTLPVQPGISIGTDTMRADMSNASRR